MEVIFSLLARTQRFLLESMGSQKNKQNLIFVCQNPNFFGLPCGADAAADNDDDDDDDKQLLY